MQNNAHEIGILWTRYIYLYCRQSQFGNVARDSNLINIFFKNPVLPRHPDVYIGTKSTVLPAKSDSDVILCLQSYQRLIIDRSLLFYSYPHDRINTQVIDKIALAQVEFDVLHNFYDNNYKQNITSLSLLVGTTVYLFNHFIKEHIFYSLKENVHIEKLNRFYKI